MRIVTHGELRHGQVATFAEYQDLRVFGCVAAREQRQPAERLDHEQVGESEEHERRG